MKKGEQQTVCHLPWQPFTFPLPRKPAIHVHVLDPIVSTQSAYTLQPPLLVLHSFTSKLINCHRQQF